MKFQTDQLIAADIALISLMILYFLTKSAGLLVISLIATIYGVFASVTPDEIHLRGDHE